MTSAVLFALLAQYLLQRRKGEAAGAIGQSSAASEQGPRLDDDAPTPVDTGPSIASQSKEFGSVSASELAKHVHRDDAWIAVDGIVYNITPHLQNHPGWSSASISTVVAILAVLGRDCSEEFKEIQSHHDTKVVAELKAYRVGPLIVAA